MQDFGQGMGFFGLGAVVDRLGNDWYESDLFSQAVGLPMGIGMVQDTAGNDRYFLGGRDRSTYGTPGIFKGAGQGFGFGFRSFLSGGIGMLYDAEGDDWYNAGNFAQGAGYAYGAGEGDV